MAWSKITLTRQIRGDVTEILGVFLMVFGEHFGTLGTHPKFTPHIFCLWEYFGIPTGEFTAGIDPYGVLSIA